PRAGAAPGRGEDGAGTRRATPPPHPAGHAPHPETGPAVRLGHEQPGPSERGELLPHRVGEAALVVGHLAHVTALRFLREERAHGVAQRVLIVAEGEVQRNAASPRNLTRMLVFGRWISRTRPRTSRSATSFASGSGRTCRSSSPTGVATRISLLAPLGRAWRAARSVGRPGNAAWTHDGGLGASVR